MASKKPSACSTFPLSDRDAVLIDDIRQALKTYCLFLCIADSKCAQLAFETAVALVVSDREKYKRKSGKK